MDYQDMTNALLLQVLMFIAWSFLLYGLASAAIRFLPELAKWSVFWQALLIVTLAPLLPFSFYIVNDLIPDKLKSAVFNSQHSLVVQTNSLVNQVASQTASQFFCTILATALLTGCVYSLLRFSLSSFRVKKFILQNEPAIQFGLFSQPQQMIIKAKNIDVYITEQAISPFVYGFFKMKILLPKHVMSMPAQQRFLLIEHELMHIERHDPRAVIIFRFCSALFWFNPLIRFFEKRFMQTMELNCDAAVLSAHPESKRHYAQSLIASIKLTTNSINSVITTCFSGTSLNKEDFASRIRMAMSAQQPKVYGLGYWLVILLTSSFFILFALTAKSAVYQQNIYPSDSLGMLPVLNARVSSGYNEVNDFRGRKAHKGIDFAAAQGTDVIASFSGRVTIADSTSLHKNYGKVVLIEQQDNKHNLYAHLDSFNVKAGQWITAGQKLGTVGSTGRVTGPHLHFEILQDGDHVDPSIYLDVEQ
ncbi:MAG: peptidoglycan DD-metalloendopeptidase family protein [Colwellia sp.]|nr:peptidoglycan DD-metalloendopeptidase family protein [Colwellia sp.]